MWKTCGEVVEEEVGQEKGSPKRGLLAVCLGGNPNTSSARKFAAGPPTNPD